MIYEMISAEIGTAFIFLRAVNKEQAKNMPRIKEAVSSTLQGCPMKADAPVGYISGAIITIVQTIENNFKLLSGDENLELINIFLRCAAECFGGKSMFMRRKGERRQFEYNEKEMK